VRLNAMAEHMPFIDFVQCAVMLCRNTMPAAAAGRCK
jgi:hypothetical protein